jgi:hypothetical protein
VPPRAPVLRVLRFLCVLCASSNSIGGCGASFPGAMLLAIWPTEKIARRGYHVSREYSTDPLEILFVREVMRTSIAALASDAP